MLVGVYYLFHLMFLVALELYFMHLVFLVMIYCIILWIMVFFSVFQSDSPRGNVNCFNYYILIGVANLLFSLLLYAYFHHTLRILICMGISLPFILLTALYCHSLINLFDEFVGTLTQLHAVEGTIVFFTSGALFTVYALWVIILGDTSSGEIK